MSERQPLCVVHIINNLPVGGAERFLTLLAPAQARLGMHVQVMTLVEPNPLEAALRARGIPHACMGRARLDDPRLVLDLWRRLRALRPDVVHTHLFYADTFGRAAARLAGVPAVVSTEHSTEGAPLSARRRAGMRWTAPLAHRIAVVSEPVRARAAARLGVPPARLAVVPNGIELESWAEAEPLPPESLGVEPDTIRIGCVGRLDDAKGHDVLLDALARLGDPRVRLLVAGDGPRRGDLERRARDLGVGAAVRWLGWRNDVQRLLKSLHVFALPSRWEGHSVALLEAMAAGCACLVSDIPELASALGDAGRRAAAGDAAAWSAQLHALIDDAALRRRCAARALEAVRRFSIEASAERYAVLYGEVLGRAAVAPH